VLLLWPSSFPVPLSLKEVEAEATEDLPAEGTGAKANPAGATPGVTSRSGATGCVRVPRNRTDASEFDC
jgi:hypothetical protein